MFRTLFSILQHRERRLFIIVLATVLVMALLEVVSIGAIVPFMGLLTQPEMVEQNRWLNWAYTTLNFSDPQGFLIFAGACLLGIFLFKNAFATFAVWLQLKFSWGVFYSLSTRLVTKYLNMPYTFFLKQNTSELEKNLVMEVGNTIMGMVQPAINLITHGIISLAILGLLFWSDPVLALVIFAILGGAYAVIYLAVQKKLTKAGADRVQANKERFKAFHESFGGVKELKVLHKEEYFINSFLGPLARFRDHTITHSLISQTPRFAIEALAFGGLLAIVLYIVGVREDFSQVIPFASLYAMAGYRMLPSLQQVMAALTSLRFYEKSVNVVRDDLRTDGSETAAPHHRMRDVAPIPLSSHIDISNVSYQYPGHEELAIDEITLKIDKKSICCVRWEIRCRQEYPRGHPPGPAVAHGRTAHHRRHSRRYLEPPRLAEKYRFRSAAYFSDRQLSHQKHRLWRAGKRDRHQSRSPCGASRQHLRFRRGTAGRFRHSGWRARSPAERWPATANCDRASAISRPVRADIRRSNQRSRRRN